MARPRCWIELRYGWGSKGIPVAQTSDPRLLRDLRDILLAEAERRTEVSRATDYTFGFIQEQELRKLRSILDMLIPANGDKSEVIPVGK